MVIVSRASAVFSALVLTGLVLVGLAIYLR
jgi:hypothetical protein